ncbi:hypothetical protein MKW94_004202, partial [Papaver nudicaule]|nr:hypothetical protein [Papaver nudicaule]
MAAASIALSSLSISSTSSIFSKPTLSCRNIRRIPFIRSAISSSSASKKTEFNISFGSSGNTTKTANPKEEKSSTNLESSSTPSVPFLIPWIVRGADGKLQVQSTPPAPLLHAMATANTSTPTKKKKKVNATKGVLTSEPKHSKAARRYYNENFRDPPQRISKVLAAAGVASRRKCEELVFEGRVTVNGSVCKTPQTKVDLAKDNIYVNGNRISRKLPPKVYLALNKPKGYICSNVDKELKSVFALLDDYWKGWSKQNTGLPRPRLFTVGRLDVATTGLIIVTNDGDFAQKLSHPSSNLTKEYIAAVEGVVSKRQLVTISEGKVIDGAKCIPDAVELLPQQPNVSKSRLRIVVHEGRNHEVRELVKNAGLE